MPNRQSLPRGSRRLHPETIATIRRYRADLDDIPDEALTQLWPTHFVSLNLHVRDLGRAFRKAFRR